jgi:hypothetical protein
MNTVWLSIGDDGLRYVDGMADFLQSEFCPFDGTPIWSTEYFRWKLGPENPAGAGYVSLALVDGRVVGVVSLTKKRLLIDGNETIGGEVGDAYTSVRMRRRAQPAELSELDSDPNSFINRSIFGRLASDVRARAETDGIQVIYGTPNQNAYPGWTKRLGYFEFKDYANQSFSRPTWRMVLKRYPGLGAVGGLLRAADNSVASAHAWLWRVAQQKFVFNQILPTDQEIERLWSRTKPATGFSLVRNAAYWRHRYITHPLAEYVLFCVRKNGELISVIAVRLASLGGNRQVFSIVEWMSEERVAFGYLLSQIVHACRDREIDLFTFWTKASGAEARAAKFSLFSRRARVPVILANTPRGQEVSRSADNFQFFMGSTDAV